MSRSKLPPAADGELWDLATKDVKPLRKRRPRAVAAKPAPPPEPVKSAGPTKPRRALSPPKPAVRPAKPPAELAAGQSAGLDRRNAERLRKGLFPIEEVLDLHGMTQERAHRALERFLATTSAAGVRCVLIVTGKGRTQEEGGVLKREVPRWLNEPGLRPLVLAIATARPNHGGSGALYLLLKRRRE